MVVVRMKKKFNFFGINKFVDIFIFLGKKNFICELWKILFGFIGI